MTAFSESLSVDLRMWREDLAGSVAHARMLGDVGLLSAAEVQTLVEGLAKVGAELQSGSFRPGPELEDVHMAVETRLTEIVGEVGKKLHTARSRNDQVATDVRLWLKTWVPQLIVELERLAGVLVDRAEKDGDIVMPGYTHLQRGQPIFLGHHLLAHAAMVERDRGRLRDALDRLDECPLGACAMAGTPLPIDRHRTAELLGFRAPTENAMDSVSARDHLCEVVSACAIAMSHLSRQAEELVIWSSKEFSFVRLSEAWSTGSSIMPQKRNPDAPELVRGKAGRVFGDLQGLLTTVKGLPLAYNRDLQEDRDQLFDAVTTTKACLSVMSGVWAELAFRRERFADELQGDFLLATEIADWLVGKGVAFREAHHVSGRMVAFCEAQGKDLLALRGVDLTQFHAALDEGLFEWLDPVSAAERRTSFGGTCSAEIHRQIGALRKRLAR